MRELIEDDHFIREQQREEGRRKYAREKGTSFRNKCLGEKQRLF